MSIEIDGAILPPNIVNKLEIFMLNVLRFRDNKDIELIEEIGKETICLDRTCMSDCYNNKSTGDNAYNNSIDVGQNLKEEETVSGKV